MRFIIKCAISLVLCVAVLYSCSSKKYNTDHSARELCDAAIEAVDDGAEYAQYSSENFKYEFGDDATEADDICIVYSVKAEDINEIGIFFSENEKKAKKIAEDCRDYIEDMQEEKRAFISSYAPTEIPKLDRASVRIYGNYVVYTILDTATSERVYERIEEMLKAK